MNIILVRVCLKASRCYRPNRGCNRNIILVRVCLKASRCNRPNRG